MSTPALPVSSDPPQTENVSLSQLQTRALDLLKNPVVLAGGAIVMGIVVARLTAGQKLRETVVRKVADLVKNQASATFFPNQSPPQEPAPTTPTPPVPATWLTTGKQLLDTFAPTLGDQLKKRLAEILPNTHN